MVVSRHCAYTVIICFAALESKQMLRVGYVLYRALVFFSISNDERDCAQDYVHRGFGLVIKGEGHKLSY